MRVRHIADAANVRDDGSLIDPRAVRHGTVVAGRIDALGGAVDPLTHLNADFDDHRLDHCIVAEALEVGAAIVLDGDGFAGAWAVGDAYERLGHVDQNARLRDWREVLAARRQQR